MGYKFRLQGLSHVSLLVPDRSSLHVFVQSLLVLSRYILIICFFLCKKDYEIEQEVRTKSQKPWLLAFTLYFQTLISRTWSSNWEMSVVILTHLDGTLEA